jgi:hypothetical protein
MIDELARLAVVSIPGERSASVKLGGVATSLMGALFIGGATVEVTWTQQ